MPKHIRPPDYLDIETCTNLLVDDFRRHTGQHSFEPLDFEEWNSRWPEKKREIMRQALHRPPKFLKRSFTKAEFVKPGDPRNIVLSDPTILARLGPITSALDHALKRHPAAIKGYNYHDRNRRMSALRQFAGYMNSDYSKFDRTISDKVLQIEYNTYMELCPAGAQLPYVKEILTVRNIYSTSWRGVKFTGPAMRGTGDANTALGNWLLNRLVFILLERCHNGFMVFLEGDDALCGFNDPLEQVKTDFFTIANHFGFHPRGTYTSTDLEVMPFCGRYLTATGPPRSVPLMIGYLTKWHVSKRTAFTRDAKLNLLRAKVLSYLAMEWNSPIVPAIAEYFLRTMPKPEKHKFVEPEYIKVLKDNFIDPKVQDCWQGLRREPTVEQRRVVQKGSFNVLSIEVQVAMEEYFDSLTQYNDDVYQQFMNFMPADVESQGVMVWPLPP